LDPVLVVGILQLLYMVYADQRTRVDDGYVAPDPILVKELIDEIDATEAAPEIDLRIENKFVPADAKRIKDDLALFGVVASPVTLNDFDYWTLLKRYISGLKFLCTSLGLFTIRGEKNGFGQVLSMPHTFDSLLSPERIRAAFKRLGCEEYQGVVDARCFLLENSEREVPLVLCPTVKINKWDVTGLGGSWTESDFAVYNLSVGQQRHWLRFELYQGSLHFSELEYMLSGEMLRKFVYALRDDIAEHASRMRADFDDATQVATTINSVLTTLETRRT